jgi:hypothetical protein
MWMIANATACPSSSGALLYYREGSEKYGLLLNSKGKE